MKQGLSLTQMLKAAEADICKAAELGRAEDADPFTSRVADNAYYYKRKLRESFAQQKSFKKLQGREGVPYAFKVLWSHFKNYGFVYDKSTPKAAFENYDCNSLELDMLKSLIVVAALIETGLVCRSALNRQGGGSLRLQNALSLMKTADNTDFSEVYPTLSESERRLAEREEHYMEMTPQTKGMYRRALRSYAAKHKCAEKEAVLKAETEAISRGVPIGAVLGVDQKPNTSLYCLTAASVLLLSLGLCLMLCPLWATVLLLVPLVCFSLGCADFFFSFLSTVKPCPALDSCKLPKGKHTLTVITTLLSDEGAFQRLEQVFLTNRGEGMLFGILADFSAAKTKNAPADAELVKNAKAMLDSLKYRFGNHFCLFIRERSPDGEGGYCGRERKRGAIEDLVSYISGGKNYFAVAAGADVNGVSFLLTLDGDTRLPPCGAAALTGMMLHPLNRPLIAGGKIIKGYGIIQPAVTPCLCTKGNTGFSALITGAGGIDVYESAGFNRQQNVFGQGVFCGKGIIDIKAYAALLTGVLPPKRVLSHDMPEGNILRTRYVSDVSFTDSVPSGVFSYFTRLHRWIRGDVQNLSLLKGYGQGFRGGIRIIGNVFRHLSPVLSFVALAAAGFFTAGTSGLWICAFALINLLSPVFYTLISRPAALRFRTRRFFSSVYGGMVQSLRTAFFETAALAHKVFITADAFLKALWRLYSGKKLLSWLTSAQGEKQAEGGISLYIYRLFPSAVAGALMFFATGLWITRLLGLLWFLYPIFAFRLSCKIVEKPLVNVDARRIIKSRAKPIWQFFQDNVNQNTSYLPPDNIQFSPVEAIAYRTSPTNIGLYLLSVVAAEDFGFINSAQAEDRIEKAVETIESLPKWKGHLYNWYSLNPCQVIGGHYVSTVDSGNLCVCLVALSRYLYSAGKTGLARRVEQLVAAADFSALYNKERHLFALGAQGQTDTLSEICYDMYMSEARSTSYFAVATGQVPVKHWSHLSRPVVGEGGHIGMASWSGTAFEFFMPQLFLPLYKDSFVYESLCFALYQQRSFSVGKLWGCSESAFLAFDSEMNYQYKAHGVQSLALARYSKAELILSPYSVYLTMCIAPKEALKTLSAYDKAGMNGKYGLYEAIDFTAEGQVGTPINSYMAHHMGMSLIACANACFDNVFVSRFTNYPPIAAFYELLQEKIPVGACIYDAEKQHRGKKPSGTRGIPVQQLTEYSSTCPVINAFGNGPCTIVADSCGHVRFSHGEITVNETCFDRHSTVKSLNVGFCNGKDVFYATPQGVGGKCSFESGGGYAAHICSSPIFSGRVKYYTDPAGSFVTETKSNSGKSYALVFSFDPQLCADKEFYAHPAFNRLFVSAEYDKTNNVLVYSKNSRNGRDCLFMAVGLDDPRIPISFETNKESYGAFSVHSPKDLIKDSYTNGVGVCVNPLCLIKTPPLAGGVAKLIVSVGRTRRECLERLSATRQMSGKAVGISVFGQRENLVLSGIFYGRKRFAKTTAATEQALWSYGVSGDYPIIALLVREGGEADARFYIELFKKLAAINIRVELVFLLTEEDVYQAPLRRAMHQLVSALKCRNFLQQRGGIFFVNGNDMHTLAVFKDASVCYAESYDPLFGAESMQTVGTPLPPVIRGRGYPSANCATTAVGGIYDETGFTVDKDYGQALPFSYVLAGNSFGSVVTQSTLGYSFYGNAALQRIAAFSGDPYGGCDHGELLYAHIGGNLYDLIACAHSVRYENGTAIYKGELGGNPYRVEVFVCADLPIKSVFVSFTQETECVIALSPVMGASPMSAASVFAEEFEFKHGAGLCFVNPKNAADEQICGFAACLGAPKIFKSLNEYLHGEKEIEESIVVLQQGTELQFLIGAAPNKVAAMEVCNTFAEEGGTLQRQKAQSFACGFLPPIKLLGNKAFNSMFNLFAPYQVAACRFFARGAFYQSGGAYGFRDQLQDCLFLVYSMPTAVRGHILRAASRQYTDGSVQHWWHPTKRHGKIYGVKTKCSDDFLWLPIAVAEYVEKTGDIGVLVEQVPYLESPPLGEDNERYEAAESTEYTESVEEHCRRALEYGKRFGSHGLPLMGSCDWNDAFSHLGSGAESVFSAFLYVIALNKFGDMTADQELKEQAAQMLERAEKCFCHDRYIRAYSGSGAPLGVDGRGACEIDALVQAFAVFAGADKDRCATAMKTAYDRLYDKENRLLKLFTPAFGRDTEYAGYINAYAKGIRENGGQYTHAAVWFAAALALCGMTDKAYSVLEWINPLKRSEDSEIYAKYKGEPYAIAADIYTAKGQLGRMGWSHYTGAAAWYCKTVLEVFMGIRFGGFDRLISVKPLMEYEATVSYKGILTIKAYKGASLQYDGKPTFFPIKLEDGEHTLTVPIA